jgi:FkbM family methyltransferase
VVALVACLHLLFHDAALAGDAAKCDATDGPTSAGVALLQGQHARAAAVKAVSTRQRSSMHLTPFTAKADQLAANDSLTMVEIPAKKGVARDSLPPHLLQLGIELLGSEDMVDYVVTNTREERVPYAGQTVTLRMVLGDGSNSTMEEEGGSLYGIESLPKDGLINLLDLGGNYGVVSIAAYLKFPNQTRAIAVEPIPSTYFLFRWNMHLNGVPEIGVENLAHPNPKESRPTTGILALYNGVSSVLWEETDFCYKPPFTMNAHTCDCNEQNDEFVCAAVAGITLDQLFDYFNGQPLTMLKMDCEGCEETALPSLVSAMEKSPDLVQRLVGELHGPSLELEDIACQFDEGKHFVKICLKDDEYVARPLRCGDSSRSLCD